jgi:hypothetical protein
MQERYVAPAHNVDGFHCPHCGCYAHHSWYLGASTARSTKNLPNRAIDGLSLSFCYRCDKYALWLGENMLFPVASVAPLPSNDMPEDVQKDFLEAREVVNSSPRAAAALLRLALQKLLPHLGEKGKNINDDIASLVKKGLPEKIQRALDALRVIGNNAVHPGQIDLRDDKDTALALFGLLNMTVDVMISQPKRVGELYDMIPNSTRAAIEKRDSSAQ